MEGEAGKKRREKSDDVIDFKATLREVNSLGVCVCVCGMVWCVHVEDALVLISSFQLLQV